MNVTWFLDPELEARCAEMLRVNFSMPHLEPFANYVAARVDSGVETERDALFHDALFDLTRLVEEAGYESTVAMSYLLATKAARDELHKTRTTGLGAVPLSGAVKALLSPYHAYAPLPPTLIVDPSAAMPGFRILGGWWAGQLIDSALIRGMSALDRLATMLALAAGVEINEDLMPAFRRRDLGRLRESYRSEESWASLMSLLSHPIFEWVKSYRDGFVHRRRVPMELHGDHTSMAADGTIYEGIRPADHFAFVPAFFDLVLRPACELTGRLIDPSTSPASD